VSHILIEKYKKKLIENYYHIINCSWPVRRPITR